MTRLTTLLFPIILLCACNPDSRKAHQLIHQVEDKKQEVENKYIQLVELYEAKFGSSEATEKFQSSIARRIADCKKNMDLITIEEHDHGDDHTHEDGHHHHHDSGLQISNEDKLIVLQEFMDSLAIIKADLQNAP